MKKTVISMILGLMIFSSTQCYAENGISGTCKWNIDDNGVLTIEPEKGESGTLENWNNDAPWWRSKSDIKEVKFKKKVIATTCYGMFTYCNNLRSADLTGLDTKKVKDMSYMFNRCSNLVEINAKSLNTSNVENMNAMFQECKSLKNIDVSGWNTTNVKYMSLTFSLCSSLTCLNLTKWNTSNVVSMSFMFQSCEKLTSLNLTNFNTSKVKSMNNMFFNCKKLITIFSNATTPSTLKAETFDTLPTINKCKLQVPTASVAKYKAAAGWKKLLVVTAGIESVRTSANNTNKIYNLNGQCISGNVKGITIKNGKKYLVK